MAGVFEVGGTAERTVGPERSHAWSVAKPAGWLLMTLCAAAWLLPLAVCAAAATEKTKPEKPLIKEYKRPHEIIMDPEKCLLSQGLLCLGPATRSACDSACINANMPCTGCMGPTSRVLDFGAKALSAVTSILDSNDEKEIAAAMDQIVDPTGTFYRYSLPASQLHRKVGEETV